MARIGKTVNFTGNRENIGKVLVDGITELSLTSGINWSYIDDDTMNIYGEQTELASLKTYAESKGLDFEILGDAPAEAVSIPDPEPTQDEIDALAFFKTAFVTAMTNEKQRLIDLIEVEYDLIKGANPIPFTMRTDIKWFRGIL